MTETMTADPGYGTDDNEAAQPLGGTFEHLSPTALTLGDNVRDNVAVDKAFLASIKEHGVLTPVTAVRADHGTTITVRDGQRRTLAAREVGLATIPVYVLPASAPDESAEVVERIAHQIVANDHRADLTDAQRARSIQQMLDAGVSQAKTAKKLSIGRETVKAAAAGARSTAAMDGLASGQLSLTEAAVVAEFEDDPTAVQELLRVAGTRMFDHKVQQIRLARASAQAYAAAAATYTAQGFTVIEDEPNWDDTSSVAIRYLQTPDGSEVTEDAINNPPQWAVLLCEDDAWADRETGQIVDETSIDWSTQHDADAVPDEGKRHADSVVETTVYTPEWFCLDYAGAGLDLIDWYKRNLGRHSDTAASDISDSHDEAARLRREAEQAEAAKRERRKVIALNRLSEAALSVRREFVRKLLARKSVPKGAAIFVAQCLTCDKRLPDEYHGDEIAAELLGVADVGAMKKLTAELGAGGDGRAQVILLALVLGALESRTPKDAWRHPGGNGWSSYYVQPEQYLRFLAANGYTLAAIETVITRDRKADDVYDQSLREQHQPEDDG